MTDQEREAVDEMNKLIQSSIMGAAQAATAMMESMDWSRLAAAQAKAVEAYQQAGFTREEAIHFMTKHQLPKKE